MKLELFIFAVTIFLIVNAYYDGKYMKLAATYKKYIQMAFFAFLGIIFYLLIKKNPSRCKNMLLHANNMIKYMPINRSSMDMISPIMDFTSGSNSGSFMENVNNDDSSDSYFKPNHEKRILQSGGKSSKRSVSETKKKYVASMQNWKCGDCNSQLTAWFEVDHKKRLEYGGTNEVDNLVALCRDCHGKKTAFENM